MNSYIDRFMIPGRVCVVTGAGGLIGMRHVEAILEGGGIPVLMDISEKGMQRVAETARSEYGEDRVIEMFTADITDRSSIEKVRTALMEKYGHIDVLINNAANNPKVESKSGNLGAIRFHNFPVEIWNQDIAVGLTGAMLCAQVFGEVMEQQGSGIIINISSDYGLIAPDQRIYRKDGLPDEEQIVKPVSYSVVKHGIIGLTKYLAAYWGDKGIRVSS